MHGTSVSPQRWSTKANRPFSRNRYYHYKGMAVLLHETKRSLRFYGRVTQSFVSDKHLIFLQLPLEGRTQKAALQVSDTDHHNIKHWWSMTRWTRLLSGDGHARSVNKAFLHQHRKHRRDSSHRLQVLHHVLPARLQVRQERHPVRHLLRGTRKRGNRKILGGRRDEKKRKCIHLIEIVKVLVDIRR